MPKKTESAQRWMTQCDVLRYNLKLPDKLKKQIKKEAAQSEMDMSTYICGVLAGEINRPKAKKKK